MYHITEAQQAVLDGFTCERLTKNAANQDLIKKIRCGHDTDVLDSLKRRGWSSDKNRNIAYYVVKDPVGEIVFFFSLRCGLMCDPDYIRRVTRLRDLTRDLKLAAAGDVTRQAVLDTKRSILDEDEFDDLMSNLGDLYKTKARIVDDALENDRSRPNENTVQVDELHAAVELVEMGVNEDRRSSWDAAAMGGKKLGTTMFWRFAAEKMLELSEIAGCEFAYLYAAGEENGGLVKYYRQKLHFMIPKKLGAIKPVYDKNCVLMCKKLFTGAYGLPGEMGVLEIDPDFLGLADHRRKYFENFNNPAFN